MSKMSFDSWLVPLLRALGSDAPAYGTVMPTFRDQCAHSLADDVAIGLFLAAIWDGEDGLNLSEFAVELTLAAKPLILQSSTTSAFASKVRPRYVIIDMIKDAVFLATCVLPPSIAIAIAAIAAGSLYQIYNYTWMIINPANDAAN
ncbi:hypothetical protein H671_8g19686 [Cricetulus griseus]|nr:hypothetical protein H671_8g19686 [Cricetulus griseus]